MDVIIFSEGVPECLKWCLESIKVHSPRSRVILIGSDLGDLLHYNCADFLKRYEEFVPLYEHHSPNPEWFELRCIKRWFVTAEFLRTTDMKDFIALDSDVLTFCDYHDLIAEARTSPFWAPHASVAWIFDRHGIEEFCDYIMETYRNKDGAEWQRMLADYRGHQKAVVGDMNLIEGFMRNRTFANLSVPHGRDNVLDLNVCLTDGFMADGDRKRLFWLDGRPYAMTDRRAIVRMNTLHCWGPYKPRIGEIWKRSRESVGKLDPMPWLT